MTVAFISSPVCERHAMGSRHPECPARLRAISDRVISSGLELVLHHVEAQPISRAALERVHTPAYVDSLFAQSPQEGLRWLDGDTAMNPHTLEAALHAAGAAVQAVDLVLGGDYQRAFCSVRPPGHHAESARAMGFCFFNNVVLAARHAQQAHGLRRVAIVDFDVHHGNGTEELVAGDDSVLFCSTFQHPFYPFSGHDSDAGNVVNTALAAGAGSSEFRSAVEQSWLPRLEAFAPQLVLVSAGFDAHAADDMGGLQLLEQDYAWVTRELVLLAQRTANGRLVSTLEGGYELEALARSVEMHLKALLDTLE